MSLKSNLIYLFVFLPFLICAQVVSGKVYDKATVLEEVKVTNLTKNRVVYSDYRGVFKIEAELNDSIQFIASFYKPQIIRVTQYHIDDILIVELKPDVNALDEVYLSNEPKEKVFDEKEESVTLQQQIKNDIKENPHLYYPAGAYGGGVNILGVIGLVANLFKSKKPKEAPIVPIGYNEFKNLFATSETFNESLLNNELKIPQRHQFLFFDYCSEREIDSKLLEKDNEFLLLEELVKSSKEFLALMEINEKKE